MENSINKYIFFVKIVMSYFVYNKQTTASHEQIDELLTKSQTLNGLESVCFLEMFKMLIDICVNSVI